MFVCLSFYLFLDLRDYNLTITELNAVNICFVSSLKIFVILCSVKLPFHK